MEVKVPEEDEVLGADGQGGNEVRDGLVEGGAWPYWSVSQGASDGGLAVCFELEVEVFHNEGGVVGSGCAVEGFFVDDGYTTSVSVDAAPVYDIVSVKCGSRHVRC